MTATEPEALRASPSGAPSLAPHKHGFWTKFFYGFGAVAYGVKDSGFSVFLLIYYNQVLGLSATLAGLALMCALVFDSAIDPIVGHMSDNLRSRWGRRHPFMYAAAIPTSLAYFCIWFPPAGLSQSGLFAFLLVMAVLVRSLITCYEIPSSALVAELTTDYDERTSYISFRFFFGWMGGLTMLLLAFSVFLKATPKHPVGQLNPDGYHAYALAAALVMFVGIMVSSLGTHRAIPYLRAAPAKRHLTLGQTLKEIVGTVGDPSALALLGTGMLIAATAGVVFSMATYLTTFFWLLKPSQQATLIFASFIAAGVGLVITPVLGRRFGKKRTAIVAGVLLLVTTPIMILLRLAGILPGIESPILLPLLFLHLIATTTLGIVKPIMVASMIADVVEQNELRTGRRTEGVLFAANAFVQKCVTGLGIFISTAILGAAHFPSKAVPGKVPAEVLTRLAVIYSLVIGGLYLGSVLCLLTYRITRERHNANLKALANAAAELPTETTPLAGRLG